MIVATMGLEIFSMKDFFRKEVDLGQNLACRPLQELKQVDMDVNLARSHIYPRTSLRRK